jgi:DnaJ-class molecular chaperone
LLLHPDKNIGIDTKKQFQELQSAYEIIISTIKSTDQHPVCQNNSDRGGSSTNNSEEQMRPTQLRWVKIERNIKLQRSC